MARIIFFEKPGCKSNTKQKRLLRLSGHEVIPENLMTHPWTPDELRKFLTDRRVTDCFNYNVPRIRDGELDPSLLTMDQAIRVMIREPLLIKRPLMIITDEIENDGTCETLYIQGFNKEELHRLIGLDNASTNVVEYRELQFQDLVTCPGKQNKKGNSCG